MTVPSPDLVARLLRRFRPASYYAGANSRGFHSLREVTLFARKPGLAPTFDMHHRYVLLLALDGPLMVNVGPAQHLLAGGEALLVPPFAPHQYHCAGAGRQPLAFIGFEATPAVDGDGVAYAPLTQGPRPVEAGDWAVVEAIEACVDDAPSLLPPQLATLLERLLVAAPSPRAAETTTKAWERTCAAATLAQADPFATVPALARACGASESVLRDDILAVTGLSAGAFARTLRLRAALPLVVRGELPAAAAAAGYRTTEAFAKALKAELGQTPGAFRRTMAQRVGGYVH